MQDDNRTTPQAPETDSTHMGAEESDMQPQVTTPEKQTRPPLKELDKLNEDGQPVVKRQPKTDEDEEAYDPAAEITPG